MKPDTARIAVGVDTGGTFTDFVRFDGRRLHTHKVLSTPAAPERAILAGVRALGAPVDGALLMTLGSTIGTNAVLEGKGVRTAYVTNRGFADTLAIARQTRTELYNLKPPPRPNPVPPECCLETGGRVTADGGVLEDLTAADLATLKRQLQALAPDAVAVNLLFSFVDARFEELLETLLGDDYFVSLSSRVCPVAGEYERGIATWLNAWIGPLMRAWLKKLQISLPRASIGVMQSHGKTVAATQAADTSVNLLLSGPAGGVIAVDCLARRLGERKVLSFDMGGTSTDVSLLDGGIELTTEGAIGAYPVAVPMVDVRTIGAGGGSIARMDEGGLLQVGPESAGAAPGPACYHSGGVHPTVTDANLLLGRLPAALHGLALDRAAAARAFGAIAEAFGGDLMQAAHGVIATVNEQMIRALRALTAEKTHDPSEFVLAGFGAAGGLHVCALADGLGVKRALAPVHAGVLSALGMLVAPRGLEKTMTVCRPLRELETAAVAAVRRKLEDAAAAGMRAQGIEDFEVRLSAELRYRGQWSCLTLRWHDGADAAERMEAAFHDAHEARYGHRLPVPVEVAALKLTAVAAAVVDPSSLLAAPPPQKPPTETMAAARGAPAVVARSELSPHEALCGPAVVVEDTATVYLAPHWTARPDDCGNLILLKKR